MIWLLNADRGSYGSVKALVDAGRVTVLPCNTYTEFEDHVTMLRGLVKYDDAGALIPHGDLIILDTVTRMADSTRGDFKLGPEESKVWGKRDIYYKGDTYNFGAYEAAGQFIMRHLRNLNNRGFRIVAVCHESDQKDEQDGSTKRAPALNKALWESLRGSSTDIFRLTTVTEDVVNAEGALVAKVGTRMLQLDRDDDAICKYTAETDLQANFRVVPKYLPNPTMRKIAKVLGDMPSFLTLYGDPGAGKTTLACSEAFDVKSKKAAE